MKRNSEIIPMLALVLCALVIGCDSCTDTTAPPKATAEKQPAQTVTTTLPAKPLAAIVMRANAQKSSALIILRDGRLEVEEYFGGEAKVLAAMSVSKSVVALAIAHLSEAGVLSLDTPLNEIFVGWNDRGLDPICVRHLLNHTSGLATARANFATENIVEHANNSERVAPPGTEFRYNNNAVDLLGAVVKSLVNQFIDNYLQIHFFAPMNITDAYWNKDRDGNPLAAGDLMIRPMDLAKIGQLMLDEGRWQGTQLLMPETIRMLVAPSQKFNSVSGLLWWREGVEALSLTKEILDDWKRHGLSESAASAALALIGKSFASPEQYRKAIQNTIPWADLKPLNAQFTTGKLRWVQHVLAKPSIGYSARGWLGQYLVVVPRCKLVALVMRAPQPEDYRNPTGKSDFGYDDFRKDIIAMARGMDCLE